MEGQDVSLVPPTDAGPGGADLIVRTPVSAADVPPLALKRAPSLASDTGGGDAEGSAEEGGKKGRKRLRPATPPAPLPGAWLAAPTRDSLVTRFVGRVVGKHAPAEEAATSTACGDTDAYAYGAGSNDLLLPELLLMESTAPSYYAAAALVDYSCPFLPQGSPFLAEAGLVPPPCPDPASFASGGSADRGAPPQGAAPSSSGTAEGEADSAGEGAKGSRTRVSVSRTESIHLPQLQVRPSASESASVTSRDASGSTDDRS